MVKKWGKVGNWSAWGPEYHSRLLSHKLCKLFDSAKFHNPGETMLHTGWFKTLFHALGAQVAVVCWEGYVIQHQPVTYWRGPELKHAYSPHPNRQSVFLFARDLATVTSGAELVVYEQTIPWLRQVRILLLRLVHLTQYGFVITAEAMTATPHLV